jgi:hypothetical protein
MNHTPPIWGDMKEIQDAEVSNSLLLMHQTDQFEPDTFG